VSGTTVYAGGSFTSVGGKARFYLAELDASTGAITSWARDTDGPVYALAKSGTTIYIGGSFSTIDNQPRNNLAAYNLGDGSINPWDPEPDAEVYALAIGGTKVYVGGNFSNIGSQSPQEIRNYLAALDATTAVATAWDPEPDAEVHALLVSGDTVYVAGNFYFIGPQMRTFLAAVNASGDATSWDPEPDNVVNALALSGNTLYVGGDFNAIGNPQFSLQPVRNYIAALNTLDNGSATSWDPDVQAEGSAAVWALAVSGTTVFAGGNFSSIGLDARNNIAALDSETGFALPWDPNANSTVLVLAPRPNRLYVGGTFSLMGETSQPCFAEFSFTYLVSGTVKSGGAAVPEVTINLTGAATKTTSTDSNGNYSFSRLSDGAYTITPGYTGYTFTPSSISVNVNWADITDQNFTALPITYSVSGTVTSSGSVLSGVTINLTGAATKTSTTDSNGNYSFSGLSNGVYTLTPSGGGYTFTPQSLSFNINGVDVTGKNFTASLVKPGKATPISPSGPISTNTPAYTWNPASGAQWYYLYVNDTTGNKIGQWYKAEDVCSSAGSASGVSSGAQQAASVAVTCSVMPPTPIAVGSASWWVIGWNSVGFGELSAQMDFQVLCNQIPNPPNQLGPTGAINTDTPAYSWNAVANGDYYWLVVVDSTSSVPINKWYTAAEAGCSGGTCSVNPGIPLPPGSAKWYVLAANYCVYSPWAAGMGFTVPPAIQITDSPKLISPNSAIHTNKPTYSWNAVAHADYYWLLANDSTGSWPVNRWYTAAEAGCSSGGTCSGTPPSPLALGNCVWYVLPWNYAGFGQLSDPMSFNVSSDPPGKPTLTSPTGSSATNDPTYTWNAVPYTEYYWLLVGDSKGSWPVNRWYSATDAGCPSGTCSVKTGIVLPKGDYNWYLLPWNYAGYGGLGGPKPFTVP
jgi:hypothetical protein